MAEPSEEFMIRVLTIFADADERESLFWNTSGPYAPLTFFAMCSDMFEWATADAEEITPENVHLLEQSLADLKNAREFGTGGWLGPLFAARVRGQRLQRKAYPGDPATAALFDACGPDRGDGR